MPATWTVTKIKSAGTTRVWQAHLLGTDEFGSWLYVPEGTANRTPDGELINNLSMAGVQLIPTEGWWTAWWWADESITIDIATPAEIDGTSIRYTDLELDLWTDHGEHGVVDNDEYDRARTAGLITDEQDRPARAAAADLDRALAEQEEPFATVGWQWFERIRRDSLNLTAYDPTWPTRFAQARDEMVPVLPTGSRVEHFGSTSVLGLSAKDCIDIAIVVRNHDQLDPAVGALESLGYEARPDVFGDGHIFLRKLDHGRRTHHLHVYVEDHPDLIKVLAFRDLLRDDADARARYQAVKVDLAAANPYDRSGYLAGKTDVVLELLEIALARRDQRGS